MKKIIVGVFLLVSLCCVGQVFASTTDKVNAAVQSAQQWLLIVDQGKYAESWDEAAQLFKAAVKQDQWVAQLNQYRAPRGEVVSRKALSANFLTSLPNAPKGEYVVIRFEVKFANGKKMIETVTPLWDSDQSWRVSGYYMK